MKGESYGRTRASFCQKGLGLVNGRVNFNKSGDSYVFL